jgi:hypothetical protein
MVKEALSRLQFFVKISCMVFFATQHYFKRTRTCLRLFDIDALIPALRKESKYIFLHKSLNAEINRSHVPY